MSDTEADSPIPAAPADKPLVVELVPGKRTWRETFRDWAPIVISVAAVALSSWTAYVTTENIKLSQLPAPALVRGLMDDGKFYGLYVRNDGMGLATIHDLRIYVDGRRFDGLDRVVREYPEMSQYGEVGWFNPKDLAVRPGAFLRLLWVGDDRGEHVRHFGAFILERTFVAATACSVYRECWTICTTDALIADGTCDQKESRQGRKAAGARSPG